MGKKKTIYFSGPRDRKNPLRNIRRGKKVGWAIGNLVVLSKVWDKRLRNILVSELKIKSLVFGNPKKDKKKKSKHVL